MNTIRDYTGFKVILRDDTSQRVIADTEVIAFDRNTLHIRIPVGDFDQSHVGRLWVLLIGQGQVFEFRGNPRKIANPLYVDIGLYQGKVKEGRTAQRYNVNSPAFIQGLTLDHGYNIPTNGLRASVTNLSTMGALVRAPSDMCEINGSFRLSLAIGKKLTHLGCSVVRKQEDSDGLALYGCRFIPIL